MTAISAFKQTSFRKELTVSNIMLGEALREVSGPFKDFVAKLEGPDGATVWWPAFKKFLCKEEAWSAWRTVTLGNELKSAQDFLAALEKEGIYVSDWAKDIMSKPEFAKSLAEADPNEEFDLEDRSVEELVGECRNASTTEVFAGAHKLGLEDCPPWIGLKLRLDYKNQPKGEYRFIGMKPLLGSRGVPFVFYVKRHESELWLDTRYAHPDYLWSPDDRWLFRRPRKVSS